MKAVLRWLGLLVIAFVVPGGKRLAFIASAGNWRLMADFALIGVFVAQTDAGEQRREQ